MIMVQNLIFCLFSAYFCDLLIDISQRLPIDIDIFQNCLIDIDIFQNCLIDIDIFLNCLVDIDIFQNRLVDIDIDIFKNGHVDIDIFQKCRFIDNRYSISIYLTGLLPKDCLTAAQILTVTMIQLIC